MSEITKITIEPKSALRPVERMQWEQLLDICIRRGIGPLEAMSRIEDGEAIE